MSETDYSNPLIRLSLEGETLTAGGQITLGGDQAHYLANVMRLKPGTELLVFTAAAGEFLAEAISVARKAVELDIKTQTRAPDILPDLWLLFAPIKKARTDFLIEKATELGVGAFQPILTTYTQTRRFNTERAIAQVQEAVEQCHGICQPVVQELAPLKDVLAHWPEGRTLYFCDEARDAVPLEHAVQPGPAAIIIGPEGGFAPEERKKLKALPFAVPVSLGPRILRAETAAAAALALFHAARRG